MSCSTTSEPISVPASSCGASLRRAAAALVPLVLAGCSSSGGDDGGGNGNVNPGGGSDAADDGDFRFFQGSLKAVDPADPTRVVTVAEGDDLVLGALIDGDFDAASGTVAGVRVAAALYVRGDELHLVDAAERRGAGADLAVDDVLATGLGTVAEIQFSPDLAEGRPHQILLEFDDGHVEVLPADGSEGPQPFPGDVVTELIDPTDGSLAGWLAEFEGDLVEVDRNLSTRLLAAVSDDVEDFDLSFDGAVFLALDGEIVVYDVADGQLTSSGFVLPEGALFDAFDTARSARELFVLTLEDERVDVVRIDADGSVTTVFTADDASVGVGLQSLVQLELLGGDRLALLYPTTGGSRLRTVRRDGTGAADVFEGELAFFGVAGSHLIVTEQELSVGGLDPLDPGSFDPGSFDPDFELTSTARVFTADGAAAATFEDAAWIGSSLASASSGGFAARSLFLLQGIASDGTHGGATLHETSASDPTALRRRLGTIPDDVSFFFAAPGFGDVQLADAVAGPDNRGDVFFFDATRADSLVRVTDTPDADETSLGL